jgi:CheY-like chemotaxis protein
MSATSPLEAAERKFRILIADDHPLIRKTVRAVLEDDPRFEVYAEVIDGAAAIEETNRLKPDVVVLNVVMPVLNGLEAAKVIKSKVPESVIVILSSDADEEFVKQAMKAGATRLCVEEPRRRRSHSSHRGGPTGRRVRLCEVTVLVAVGLKRHAEHGRGSQPLSLRWLADGSSAKRSPPSLSTFTQLRLVYPSAVPSRRSPSSYS